MNNLAKLTILVSLLFLGGCAQHSGYYAGRSHSGAVGISIDSYIPFNSYYERDTYYRRPVKYKSHAYNSGYDAHLLTELEKVSIYYVLLFIGSYLLVYFLKSTIYIS